MRFLCVLLLCGVAGCTPSYMRDVVDGPVRRAGVLPEVTLERSSTLRLPSGACVHVATAADSVGHAFEREALAERLARALSTTHAAVAAPEPVSEAVALAKAAGHDCAFLVYPRLEDVQRASLAQRARKRLSIRVYDVAARRQVDALTVAVVAPAGRMLVRPEDLDVALAGVATTLSGR